MTAFLKFITTNKDLLTVLLSTGALLISTLALLRPWFKDVRTNQTAIFQAFQEDRKSIAVVTLRVTNGEWDKKLNRSARFRARLLRSLAVAAGLESSDRGKAYVLEAFRHIVATCEPARAAVLEELHRVKRIFEAYERTNADPKFGETRLKPLCAIISAVESAAAPASARRA